LRCVACLLGAVLSDAMAHWRWPGARTMATLAYCLYLTNKQVFYWVDVHADLDAAPALARKLLAAFAVAGLLHLLVERPGLAPRAGVPSPHPACSLLIHRWHVRSGGRHARRDGTDIARISVQLLAHPITNRGDHHEMDQTRMQRLAFWL
jgi:peptidoglycan/LPS O-acetylase OafA/YrhL